MTPARKHPASQSCSSRSNATRPVTPPFSAEEWSQVVKALGLTPRQADVVFHLMHARKDKQIAQALDLCLPTVRMHLKDTYRATEVNDRMELAIHVFATLRRLEEERQSPR